MLKNGGSKDLDFRKAVFTLFVVLVIILIFALMDYFSHQISVKYSVPPRYFPNKIIYGTIIGFITSLFARKWKLFTKALIFSLVISVLLQIKYFLEGYPRDFVFLFLGIHFVILLVVSFIVFKLTEKDV
ncbi:hypothetical protein HYV88_02445 [Candidatus Woesearchaeota archaeon]|nr:hypothetical protein [Candidatus Woesearchaeota archaeon]